jgi:hypothetical protein
MNLEGHSEIIANPSPRTWDVYVEEFGVAPIAQFSQSARAMPKSTGPGEKVGKLPGCEVFGAAWEG